MGDAEGGKDAKGGDKAKDKVDELDEDGDGKVSPDEWKKGKEQAANNKKERKKAAEEKEKEKEKEKGDDAVVNPKTEKKLFKDGKPVSNEDAKKELEESGVSSEKAKAKVEELDEDGDGKVSPDERKKGKKQAAKKKKERK